MTDGHVGRAAPGQAAEATDDALSVADPGAAVVARVDRAKVEAAALRIAGHVRRTPIMTVDGADFGLAEPLALKLEGLQHAGSFKSRGAFNTLLATTPRPTAIAAASGGNHGAAVAHAARALGVPATIFVPEISSPVKIAAIRARGAQVHVEGARYADAQALCDAHVAREGALSVHPFDAAPTIAGQGTVAREWEAQRDAAGLATLDTVLVAVGGGGLIAGISAWWGGQVRIVGVEPEGAQAFRAARSAGEPVDVSIESVAADSLGAKRVGAMAFATAKDAVDQTLIVADDDIRRAQGLLWSRLRLASEPGGAAAFSALLSGAYRPTKGERVGVLLCGANVDLDVLNGLAAMVDRT